MLMRFGRRCVLFAWMRRFPVFLVLLAGPLAAEEEGAKPRVEEIVVRAAQTARSGPGLSPTGSSRYGIGSADIDALARGRETPLSDVLAHAPGVAIDQNQQIHIRNTEGPQFQYNIDGMLVPFDINTNPPFLTMLNAGALRGLDLQTGILPSRYSYATGGVVDLMPIDGCAAPGGSASMTFGQRQTLQPMLTYAGCEGRLSYVASATYLQNDQAFSSATPTINAIHDIGDSGQAFAHAVYHVTDTSELIATASIAASDNQLPNVPNLTPAYQLAGVSPFNSSRIDSSLNFRDALGMLAFRASPNPDLTWQIGYAVHSISESFRPDVPGELIYQGVASRADHTDFDNTLQGDISWRSGAQTITGGFYAGNYRVIARDRSLVFPVDEAGNQASDVPLTVSNKDSASNVLLGAYLDDLWEIAPDWKLNAGLRLDSLTGFTRKVQLDPTVNLTWTASPVLTLHGGVARTLQVPSFQGISPTAYAAFLGTTAEGPPGIATPLTEDDWMIDVGGIWRIGRHLSLSQDVYYEITHHYLDTGQFGSVPIFAPFNYGNGTVWGSETALSAQFGSVKAYVNLTLGRNTQRGVVTGQFNFAPDELAFINAHLIDLDHQPLFGAAFGATWTRGPLTLSTDAIYSSGLRAGFADLEHLPATMQVNASAEYRFRLGGIAWRNRVAVLNLFDRTNLIRPAEGIGIFQSAYGPRLTLLDTVSIALR